MTGAPAVGQLVRSLAGRDRGLAMVVVAVLDEHRVLVTDGGLRPGARPKRKNVRHLGASGAIHPGLAGGVPPSDAELREWISAATAKVPDGGSRGVEA